MGAIWADIWANLLLLDGLQKKSAAVELTKLRRLLQGIALAEGWGAVETLLYCLAEVFRAGWVR